MYLTFASISLLLLLTWHYSIQVTAHNRAKDQVFTWLQSMNASAERVEFRMLRGALSIHNIKATLHGGALHIDKIFIKGNPNSITSNEPQLQYIGVEQLTYDASHITSPFQALNTLIPTSLAQLFYHTNHIIFQDGSIYNLHNLPPITLSSLDITGSKENKHIKGRGMVGASSNPWTISSEFPFEAAKQQGALSVTYKNIQTDSSWSGSSQLNNFQASIHQTDDKGAYFNASIQQTKQWVIRFDAQAWELNLPQIETTLTGAGKLLGFPKSWDISSKKLVLNNSYFPDSEIFVSQMTAENLTGNSKKKSIAIQSIEAQDIILNLNTAQAFHFLPSWNINVSRMDIKELETAIYVHDEPVILPILHGSSTVQHSNIQFDFSNQADDTQFIRIQKREGNSINISAEKVPLHQLRNILPQPIQNKALTIQGETKLNLSITPNKHWETTGAANITNIQLSSKDQTFLAQKLHLSLQQANMQGVQQASLIIDNWKLQLPLTPRQAWNNQSHLDDWASIPWQFKTIHMNHGEVTIGGEHRTWFKNSNIHIQGWQSPSPAQLTFEGQFGMAPLQTTMTLQSDQEGIMQWKNISIQVKHANMFSLSDWLEISGFPRIQKGHLDLNIQANQSKQTITGSANIRISHLQTEPMIHINDFLAQTMGENIESIIPRLQHKGVIRYNLTLNAEDNEGLGEAIAHQLLSNTQKQLAKASPPHVSNSKTHNLGSLRIHQNTSFSHNERSRLRKIIQRAKRRGWHIELVPDLGTAELSPTLRQQIYQTQTMVKRFMSERGIKAQNIYLISAQQRQQSESSNSAIHIRLVK